MSHSGTSARESPWLRRGLLVGRLGGVLLLLLVVGAIGYHVVLFARTIPDGAQVGAVRSWPV
jgi:hypothetical protein